MNKEHKTNNISEGWHNRFRLVVGKHHLDLYSCLTEFQKEQAYSEMCISELALEKRINSAPKKQWVALQEQIQDVSREYEAYKANDTELEYLWTLGHNIVLN